MSTNELLKRLQKLGVTKDVADTVNKSDFFSKKNIIDTGVPVMNLALSGSFDGGLLPGITFVAGPKATFKTNMCLRMVSAYLKKYEDAICILYDTEFGITPEYLTQCGIDTTRVLHVPIGSVEQLKLDITPKLKEIKKGDHVIFMIDSVGNLPSEKEINDAEDGKIVGDMSRAKSLKSLFRIITSNLAIKDIPMIAINHVYAEIGVAYSSTIMSGGEGAKYAANTIWIISKRQEKDGKELEGFTFTISIEKSRYLREKSRIPLRVTFDGGIDKYSGIFEMAQELEFIMSPKMGWYCHKDNQEKLYRKSAMDHILAELLKSKDFISAVENKYKLSGVDMLAHGNEATEEATYTEDAEDDVE